MPHFDWDSERPGGRRLEDVKNEWKLMIRLVERIWSQRDSAPMRQIANEWFTERGSTAAMAVLGNILRAGPKFTQVTVTNCEIRTEERQEKHRQMGAKYFLLTTQNLKTQPPSATISLLEPAFELLMLGDIDYGHVANKEASSELEHLAGALLHEVTYVSAPPPAGKPTDL